MDPSILTLMTAAMESVVNTALRYDPASRQQLAELTDILAIHSTTPRLSLYCCGSEDGIRIMSYCDAPVTTQLTGSPLALLSLIKQPTSLAGSGVELSGSIGLLQQWQGIMHQLDIDWEDAISQVLGDIAGPTLANNLRQGANWFQDQQQQQWRLVKEYLPEEIKLIPSKTELDCFYQDVSNLSLDTDRIHARLNNIIDTLKQEKGNVE